MAWPAVPLWDTRLRLLASGDSRRSRRCYRPQPRSKAFGSSSRARRQRRSRHLACLGGRRRGLRRGTLRARRRRSCSNVCRAAFGQRRTRQGHGRGRPRRGTPWRTPGRSCTAHASPLTTSSRFATQTAPHSSQGPVVRGVEADRRARSQKRRPIPWGGEDLEARRQPSDGAESNSSRTSRRKAITHARP